MNPKYSDGLEMHLHDIVVVHRIIQGKSYDRGFTCIEQKDMGNVLAEVVDFYPGVKRSVGVKYLNDPNGIARKIPHEVKLADFRDIKSV